MAQPSTKNPNYKLAVFTLTVFSVYFHVFMEWLFFITKPSAFSPLSVLEKLQVLVVSGGIFVFIPLAGLILLSIPALLTKNPKWKGHLSGLRLVPSAFLFSITALILLDNFTYTLFKFGIITATGAWRIIYILGFILIFRWMYRFSKRLVLTFKRSASFVTFSLLTLSMTGILAIYFSHPAYPGGMKLKAQTSVGHPNIIILGADGLSANYLSAYGYKSDTTPFLSELAKTSLVAENAFSNASSTTASTTSALTGKEPAVVNVFRYPDILTDEDSFEHLPGILKDKGYKTVQIGTSYYVDAEKLNLLNGFDIVNNRSMEQPVLDVLRSVLGNSSSTLFIQTIAERAAERLLHIFFLEEMQNPFETVNNPRVRMTDAERVDRIVELLEHSEQPLFIFSHFMNTHGPKFSSEHISSTESSIDSEEEWDLALYEQAIRSFDNHVNEIFTYLVESGKMENTILVIYTDHGYRYTVNQRIPIIIHFPENDHAGSRRNNVEIIDIPVTLLDYLRIPQPEWMTGRSMLDEDPPATRNIVSITAGSPRKIQPPFFQIKTVQVIVCQKWYALNVQENTWKSGYIRAHTAPCPAQDLPPDSDIHQAILDYLDNHGYDTKSLR